MMNIFNSFDKKLTPDSLESVKCEYSNRTAKKMNVCVPLIGMNLLESNRFGYNFDLIGYKVEVIIYRSGLHSNEIGKCNAYHVILNID